jgi:hypothetical protein
VRGDVKAAKPAGGNAIEELHVKAVHQILPCFDAVYDKEGDDIGRKASIQER